MSTDNITNEMNTNTNHIIGTYINGNFMVTICEDGTKIKATINPDDTQFIAEFPESIDLKITNKCDMSCPYCHEDSCPWGAHGNLKVPFIDTLKPYTEVAIGGGNPLTHPSLESFLKKLQSKKIIANMTINGQHLQQRFGLVDSLMKRQLIHGLGISVTQGMDMYKILRYVKMLPHQYRSNIILHVIAGIVSPEFLQKCVKIGQFYGIRLKVLVLGYKQFRKGKEWFREDDFNKSINRLKKYIPQMFNDFAVVCFDNLALVQLDIKSFVDDNTYNLCYMGDDGSSTMFIDLVEGKFAVNSTSSKRYSLKDNITDMFTKVKKVAHKDK